MAYYLTIEKKKGEYLPLNITEDSIFTRVSKLKGAGASLQEIDMYTTMFNNETELRMMLLKNGLLPAEYANKPLSIRQIRNKKYHKVMNDILYQKDIEYLIDPRNLIIKINNRLQSGDYRFVSKLATNYMSFYECSSTAPEVREFAEDSIRYNRKSRHFSELDENRNNPLVRMVKLLIYEHYQSPNGKIEYKNKIIYRNLHSLIAFVNNYDKKHQDEVVLNEVVGQQSLFKEKPKTKRKAIDGQYSLF